MNQRIRVCNRCGYAVFKSGITSYPWQCFTEDEDIYHCETKMVDKEEYVAFVMKNTGCSYDETEELCDSYERYVEECIRDGIKDRYPVCMQEYYENEYQILHQPLQQT